VQDAGAPGSAKGNATDWPVPYNTVDNSRDVAEWSRALEQTGKDVWLAISWEIDPDFASEFVSTSNSWRVSMDIDCYCDVLVKWNAVSRVFPAVVPWLPYSGSERSTGRPDLDSLNLGNGNTAWGTGLSATEEQSYAVFWAIVGAPMYTGVDLTLVSAADEAFQLLTNPVLRALNAASVTATPDNSTIDMTTHPSLQTWRTDFGNGTIFLGFFNLDSMTRNMRWSAPQRQPFTAKDALHERQLPCSRCAGQTGELVLKPHESLLLRLEFGHK
jgi:alpha-galactosidase